MNKIINSFQLYKTINNFSFIITLMKMKLIFFFTIIFTITLINSQSNMRRDEDNRTNNITFEELKNEFFTINDLYINGNETPNIISLKRIFNLLVTIQKNLLSG